MPRRGLEPPRRETHGPEPCASTNSATWAQGLEGGVIRSGRGVVNGETAGTGGGDVLRWKIASGSENAMPGLVRKVTPGERIASERTR